MGHTCIIRCSRSIITLCVTSLARGQARPVNRARWAIDPGDCRERCCRSQSSCCWCAQRFDASLTLHDEWFDKPKGRLPEALTLRRHQLTNAFSRARRGSYCQAIDDEPPQESSRQRHIGHWPSPHHIARARRMDVELFPGIAACRASLRTAHADVPPKICPSRGAYASDSGRASGPRARQLTIATHAKFSLAQQHTSATE